MCSSDLLGGLSSIKGGKTINMVGKEMNSYYGYKVVGCLLYTSTKSDSPANAMSLTYCPFNTATIRWSASCLYSPLSEMCIRDSDGLYPIHVERPSAAFFFFKHDQASVQTSYPKVSQMCIRDSILSVHICLDNICASCECNSILLLSLACCQNAKKT